MINRLSDAYLDARDALCAAIVARERLMVAYRDECGETRKQLYGQFLAALDRESRLKRECDRLMAEAEYPLAHVNRRAGARGRW